MDAMDRYKIQESIKDAIRILDSAPIQPDMAWETNAVQLTNRAPIAHLAIEKGLKALIVQAESPYEHIHGLQKLYQNLNKCDKESAEFLSEAFDDAVKFFRYNVNVKGFGHLRSLDDYLSKVGIENVFEALRYWAIGESPERESPIPPISLPIHREILCALRCLFFPKSRWGTVSDRAERTVAHAMFNGRGIVYCSDNTSKEQSVNLYKNWLIEEHSTCRSALEEAVQKKFLVKDDEFVNQTVRDAFDELRQSEDPAVRFYIGTLADLPKGSQVQYPDAIPEVEWFNSTETGGMLVTPAGSCLGFIEKYANGGWGITPSGDGPVQVTKIAKVLKDAKAYLVNRLTKSVIVTVKDKSRQLRIVTERDFFPAPAWTTGTAIPTNLIPEAPPYDLEFWDANHGLSLGDEVSIELRSGADERIVSVLKGRVVAVSEQEVSIKGMGGPLLRSTQKASLDDSIFVGRRVDDHLS